MVDQLGAKWLELALNGAADVPNISGLIESGAYFTQAFASNPVCSPSRATLATGMTTRQHGVLENGYWLNAALPTFMKSLRDGGWRTTAIGKVHFQPHFAGVRPDYRPYGFDETHITEDARAGEWLDWVLDNHPSDYEMVLSTVWASELPELKGYGSDARDLAAAIREIRRTSPPWLQTPFPHNDSLAYPLPFRAEISQTEWITARAGEMIADSPPDQPLFAHVSYVQPHSPFTPPATYLDRVNTHLIGSPLAASWFGDPVGPDLSDSRVSLNPEGVALNWRWPRTLYFADIAHLDAQVGTLRAAIEARGRQDNTYILLLSDHGELLFDHGFIGKEHRHYEACVRIPLVIAGPQVRSGQRYSDLVQMEDVCPTILAMAGLRGAVRPSVGPYQHHSQRERSAFYGESLMPLLTGEREGLGREAVYVESYNTIWSNDASQWARTVRTAEYRYTWYPNGGGEQLFELGTDPDEMKNLAGRTDYASLRTELRDRLIEMIVAQDYPKTFRDLYSLGVH